MCETRDDFLERNKKIQELFLRIPVWNGQDDLTEKTLSSDQENGVPTLRLEDWTDYQKLLARPFFQERRKDLIFRGQRQSAWSLEPTLWRGRDANVAENGLSLKEYRKQLAETQLAEFRKRLRNRAGYNIHGMEDDDLWAIGQHQFLQTPLLDWTFSPYVALYFAFWNENSPNERDPLHNDYSHFRVVYVLDSRLCSDSDKSSVEKIKNSDDEILLIKPKEDPHGRLISQDGLFTFGPYAGSLEARLRQLSVAREKETGEMAATLFFKILIPNRDGARVDCLNDLMWMNVHSGALFPDIYGASEHCNISLDIKNTADASLPTAKKAECRSDHLIRHFGNAERLKKLKGKEEDWPPSFMLEKDGLDLEMVLIRPEQDGVFDDQKPPPTGKKISRPFYIGKYPLTWRQWRQVMGKDDETIPEFLNNHLEHPLVGVRCWEVAKKFLQQFNTMMKDALPLSFRLPTAAEWEYACR
ncbi:MAG: FRG domain-containing protein, partial [Desulfobulbaceae bacterium]|nr:FRG domain-containing protein [Desulfobulbaceae bacterium]